MPSAEMRLTIQMVIVGRLWRARVDELLRPLEQSASRLETLGAIFGSPPLSQQIDIAKRLRIEGPSLTRMLHSLEKEGLVSRQPDPNDGRSKLLALTETGQSVLEEIFDLVDGMRVKLFDGIDRETIKSMSDNLSEVIRRLESGLPD